jgi:hypothetical protein
MKSDHEEIRGLLPEYIRNSLSGTTKSRVASHLKDCPDCQDEVVFLAEIAGSETPDPGELFWATLPRKVKIAVGNRRQGFTFKYLFGGLPAAAVAALLLFAVLSSPVRTTETGGQDLMFTDPLTVSTIDYAGITEKDIPQISSGLADDELYLPHQNFTGRSYYREVASLSSREIDSLYEALEQESRAGG